MMPATLLGSNRANRRFALAWWLLLAGVWLAFGSGARAADDEPKDEVPPERRDLRQKLSAVKEWQGIWETRIEGGGNKRFEGGANVEYGSNGQTHGSFLLPRYKYNWDPRRGILEWRGDGEVSGQVQSHYSLTGGNLGGGTEWQSYQQGAYAVHGIEFKLWLNSKGPTPLVHFLAGGWGVGGKQDNSVPLPRRTVTGRKWSRSSLNDPFTVTSLNEDMRWQFQWGNLSRMTPEEKWKVVSGGSGVLEFKTSGNDTSIIGPVEYGTPQARLTTRVLLFPVDDNLEVEVTIDGYDDWRPQGKISDPKKAGNNLRARATLKSRDGKPPEVMSPVRRFVFELKDTSREPGVCMNWPLNAKDNDPDLRLAVVQPGDQLSEEDQKLIVKTVRQDDQQQYFAEAQVDSYDFGGQAELRVTCELEDGREIIGLIKDDKGAQDIVRVPKTNGPRWIAQSWLEKKGITDLSDDDDEEKVEGQDYKGDGFTLYEEYRGFVENGVRIECDPKKKDLFIVNMADVASREGFSLLERIAKLRVHGRLREDKEMNTTARLMNGNRRAGPHRVDQHGVILSNRVDMNNYKAAGGGAQVPVAGADQTKAARPRDTSYCYIVPPDAIHGIFSATSLKLYDLTHLSFNQLYAAAVAHELLHAIGVDHHGDQLMDYRWGEFQSSDNPKNPTGKPRFLDETLAGNGPPVFYLWEDSGASVAEDQQAVFNQYVAQSASGGQDWYRHAAEYWCNRLFFVGKPRGTDSGEEACVMRYYFATAYAAKGKSNTFYVIRPGAKQAETTVCTGAKGTGGNAAAHSPQPRFGDAADGRGDCFAQICPNDAIPPRSISK